MLSHLRSSLVGAFVAAIVVCLLPTVAQSATRDPVFIVSPQGNDAWSGSLAAPNATRTDGPFATLDRARQAARAAHGGTIRIRGGTYRLSSPIVLTSADSHIHWEGAPGERVVITGGQPIKGWQQRNGAWVAKLPTDAPYFEQLYVNHSRRQRPRVPASGYASSLKVAGPSAAADVEVIGFHQWTTTRTRANAPDTKAARWIIENVDRPLLQGEWYLDRSTRELSYMPRPTEELSSTLAIAPVLPTLVQIAGRANDVVMDVSMKDLTLQHTAWNTPKDGWDGGQAETRLPAAIDVTNGQDITLERIEIAEIGATAIAIHRGSRRVRVIDCDLHDLGGGGIRIGDASVSEAVTSEVTVRGTRVVGAGRVHPGATGIWIGQSGSNTIHRNEVADLYYSAISIGWTWGSGRSHAKWNLVTDNDIHDVGQGVLDDLGGIYTLGPSFGTAIRHNHIRTVRARAYGGWGIYLDEGSSGVIVENNFVEDCQSASVYQNYGDDNWVTNNVLAFAHDAQLGHCKSSAGLVIERNVIVFDRGALFAGTWDDVASIDRNIYWRLDARPFDFAGHTLDEWQRHGRDEHSTIGNPGKRDTKTSTGFVPFDELHFGPIVSRKPFATLLSTYDPEEPLVPAPLHETFEGLASGEAAAAFQTEEDPKTSARVIDGIAASGRRSLRLHRSPRATGAREWRPFVAYDPRFTTGLARATFSLRFERGALAEHEWRDSQVPYRRGPAFQIERDGTLRAGAKALQTLPADTWVTITVEAELGRSATGTWSLAVSRGAEAPIWYRDLRCDSGFQALRWFGFIDHGPAPSTFYVDDVDLDVRPD